MKIKDLGIHNTDARSPFLLLILMMNRQILRRCEDSSLGNLTSSRETFPNKGPTGSPKWSSKSKLQPCVQISKGAFSGLSLVRVVDKVYQMLEESSEVMIKVSRREHLEENWKLQESEHEWTQGKKSCCTICLLCELAHQLVKGDCTIFNRSNVGSYVFYELQQERKVFS